MTANIALERKRGLRSIEEAARMVERNPRATEPMREEARRVLDMIFERAAQIDRQVRAAEPQEVAS